MKRTCNQECTLTDEQVCCLECKLYSDCKFPCDTLDEIEYAEQCENYIKER